jgi:hypothetical protein
MRASVTVSIAALSSGTSISIPRVRRVFVETSEGMTSLSPGRRRTSSYVRPVNPKGSCSLGAMAQV